MEFPELGVTCQLHDCKTLDFLPFTCTYCENVFCKHHYLAEAHKCTKVAVVTGSEEASAPKNITCSTLGCSTTDVVAMLCVKCHLHFCLNHRYHSCFEVSEKDLADAREQLQKQREKVAEAYKNISDKIDANLDKNKKSGRNTATTLKVQLMRIKGKAKGEKNIAEASRVFFLIYPPRLLAAQSKPVYVSKDWTVGRVIDSVSSLIGAANKNNEAYSSKLRIFKKCNGCQVSADMSEKLGNLTTKGIVDNGESLILEYVSPECFLNNYCISNPDEYL